MEFQKKFATRKVSIGNVDIGFNNPIRIQSMTNTKTEDIEATTNQIISLQNAGCEIVRVTAQGKKQALALESIKNVLIKKNCLIPIVADIHFYPPAAYFAADFVEKIRINPGNFAEKKILSESSQFITDQEDLARIEENLFPLIEKLKKQKKALRIGVNHGSLSNRILKKYGNTIDAMIKSAFEYASICRKLDFHNFVFSMKASSSFLTIQANRALVEEMKKMNWDYPIHLGVTEAGDEEDGIIKSSIGIGSLLLQGIGDTIRVSLTEDPIKEIQPAIKLVELCKRNSVKSNLNVLKKESCFNKIQLGAKVDNNFSEKEKSSIDFFYSENIDLISKEIEKTKVSIITSRHDQCIGNIYINIDEKISNNTNNFALKISSDEDFEKIIKLNPTCIIFEPPIFYFDELIKINNFLFQNKIKAPLILKLKYLLNLKETKILASSEIGLILYDKLADGIILETKYDSLKLSLDIFQACGLKKYKPDYISCPGCGRTLYDIQTTLKKIKERTSHLSDIKIAVMGCIVNGPGEMQDADFGYVGSAPKKIDLYIKNECIEKNIDESMAVEKLIELIKKNDKWH